MEKAKRIYYLDTNLNEITWSFSETDHQKNSSLQKIGPMAQLMLFTDKLLKERAAMENMAEQMSTVDRDALLRKWEMQFGPDPRWEIRENKVLRAIAILEAIAITLFILMA